MRSPGDLPLHLLAGTALVALARAYWRYRLLRGPTAPGRPVVARAAAHLRDAGTAIAWGLVVAHTVNPSWFAWTEWQMPYVARAIAAPAVIVTVVMLSWVVREAEPCYRAGGSGRLFTTGAYGVIRHPLYVATVAALASLTVLSASAVMALITLLTAIELIWRRASREDRALAARFGAEFDAYRARVPAFLRFGGDGHPSERRES